MSLSKKTLIIGLIVVLVVAGATITYAKSPDFRNKVDGIIPVSSIPIISNYLGDDDGDGILNYKDPHPKTHNFPATVYSKEKGLPQDIVDQLTPLNGPSYSPQLDTNEKNFIDYLSGLDHDLQKQLIKLAQDGKIEENDLVLYDYLKSLDPVLANKITSAFSTEMSTGAISEEAADQLKFLKGLPADKQRELIENGQLTNYDLDGDGMNNLFEATHELYNPYAPNGRYAILVNTFHDDFYTETNRMAKFLIEEKSWNPEDIIVINYVKGTVENFKEGVNQTALKSDENSMTYLRLHSHGNKVSIGFNDGAGINDNPFYSLPYKEINDLLNKINGNKVISIDACECYHAIPQLDGEDRVIMVSNRMFLDSLKGECGGPADSDGDRYSSVFEIWDKAHKYWPGWYYRQQGEHPNNSLQTITNQPLASELYFCS